MTEPCITIPSTGSVEPANPTQPKVRVRWTEFVIQEPGVTVRSGWQTFSSIITTTRGHHALVNSLSNSSWENYYRRRRATATNRLQVRQEDCACLCTGRESWSVPRVSLETIIIATRKRASSGKSLVLCPLDALQVDALLNHLPQRTGIQTNRQTDKTDCLVFMKTIKPFQTWPDIVLKFNSNPHFYNFVHTFLFETFKAVR